MSIEKILISLSEEQDKALDELMSEDIATNRSAYIASLIGDEMKRRKVENEKRGVGRPRDSERDGPVIPAEDMPDYSDDQPKNIPHFGRMIGKREYQDIEEAAQAFRATL